MSKSTISKFKIWRHGLRVGFGLAIAFLLCQINTDYLDFYTYDLRIRLKPASEKSNVVETVAIGIDTIEELKRDPNASDNIMLLEALKRDKPLAVVYVFDPSNIVGTFEELEKLVKAAKDLPFYIAGSDLQIRGLENEALLPAPLDQLTVVSAPKTMDSKTFAKDNVTRRFIFSFQNRQTLHPMLAAQVTGRTNASDYRGVFEFYDSHQAYIDYRPQGTYRPIRFSDVMNSRLRPGYFTNKIVLVGRNDLTTSKDYVQTPYSRDMLAMSNLEMHANILDTLITDNAPIQASYWVDLLLTSLISILTVFVVLNARPAFGLMILVGSMTAFALLAHIVFMIFGYAVGMAHPLIAIFISYYFFIPYRLIMENRKSWEYYQRNKLLTQVEELKSNFLRMMSHDLKTPLARIQGMSDLIQRSSSNLSDEQQEAVATISASSQELSDFIGSVLNLGRIESKEIKLHIKSRDINKLLSDIAAKLNYLAKSKKIEIITDFEPLFSVDMDEDLLRQVFTNLVENAIKYSPENSKIMISTEEVGGRVVVQVADQGFGIPKDELEHIFEKFYRSKTVTTTNIKGTGLGLYLSNYFVNLHRGRILVDSELKKGSTFTVELPMELNH